MARRAFWNEKKAVEESAKKPIRKRLCLNLLLIPNISKTPHLVVRKLFLRGGNIKGPPQTGIAGRVLACMGKFVAAFLDELRPVDPYEMQAPTNQILSLPVPVKFRRKMEYATLHHT